MSNPTAALMELLYGNLEDDGDLDIILKRLEKLLNLLVKNGTITTDQYEELQ